MDNGALSPSSPREKLSDVVALYRRLLRRYRKIEALSSQAVRTLRTGCEVRELNAALDRKRALWQEIREEEDRVTGAREWWKRSRPSLATEECRELLSLLEAIGKTLEEAIAQEDECRALLTESIVWKRSAESAPDPPAKTTRGDRPTSPLPQEEPL